MKKAMLAVVVTMFALGMVACGPSVEDAFNDVQETAPSYCKNSCQLLWDCTYDDFDYSGDNQQEEALFNERVEECVVDCAYPAAEGGFVFEESSDPAEGDEIAARYPGSAYEGLGKCFDALDIYECDAADVGGFTIHNFYLDYLTDEENCDLVDDCIDEHMGDYTDLECEWDETANECDCEGDEVIEGYEFLYD